MPTRRIVNASPLILLTKIGQIELLEAEGVDVVVPRPVLQEVSNLDPSDPVVRAIQQGKSNKIIANELNMCLSTVKVHVRNVMRKLNAKNRTEVAMKT